MTSEQFVNKYGEPFFKATKLVSFYNDVDNLISTHVEKVKSLESELKEKDIVISEYHTKMLADKESYFEVVEAHDDLKSQLKEIKEFAIWMTGCHDFTKYDWFIRQRDKLLKSKSDA